MSVAEQYTPELKAYVQELYGGEGELLRRIRLEQEAQGLPMIEVGADEGRFLSTVARAVSASLALEIGTLAGYSAAWIASGLAPGGRLVTLEASREHAELARRLLADGGLADVVDVRLGNALDLLPALDAEGPFDFVFIDADKDNYPAYLDHAIRLCRPGAAILAHNVYLGGDVVGGDGVRADAVRAFNETLARDPRLVSTVVPLRDGMAFAVVREAGT